MDVEGYRQFLIDKGTDINIIAGYLAVVDQFELFLNEHKFQNASSSIPLEAIGLFSEQLIEEGQNNFDNYLALIRYAQFRKDMQAYRWLVELVDGHEAMQNLYSKLGKRLDEEVRDRIFEGIPLPILGVPSSEKSSLNQRVMERLEAQVDPDTCKSILGEGLRDLRDEWYLAEREKYLGSENLDVFLEQSAESFISELEHLHTEGLYYYTQPVTREVVEFVRQNREIAGAVRDGDVLYQIKIPYLTQEYLDEPDEQKKRYFYCHCPWVRESLRLQGKQISPTFCNCSAAFMKKPFEVILDQPLQAEMVETVLQGDPWCRVAIHLPQGV